MTPDPGSPWCLPIPVAPGDYHSRAPCRLPGTQSLILLPYLLAPVARSSSYDTRPLAVSPWFLPTPVAPSTSQGPRQLPQKAPSRLAGIQTPVSTQHLPSPLAPGGLPGRVPCRLLGTQAPVSPWHLPAPMAPGSFCGPKPPNRLPQIQFPSSPWSLTALEAPGSSHGSKQLHWLQALRGPLQVQAPNTSGCQSAPTVPGGSAQLATTAPSSFLSSRLLEGSHEPRPLIHSCACCLPWTQAAPVAPGFWPIPVQAATWGIRFQVGSHESTFLAHPNISQLSSPPGAPGRLQ